MAAKVDQYKDKTCLDPQMAKILERQNTLGQSYPDLNCLTADEIRSLYADERRFWNEDAQVLQKICDIQIEGLVRPIPLRIYYPDQPNGSNPIFFLHGGGWLVGNPDTHDKITRLMASNSGYPVVSIDYALAPRHKFPIAITETLMVVEHMLYHGANYGLSTQRIGLAGDSAGANMSAACGLLLGEKYPSLVAKLGLFYGGFGLHDSPSRRLYGSKEDGLTQDDLLYYQQCYLKDSSDRHDPRYCVLNANLDRFPPAFIAAASLDPLCDDSVALSAKLDNCGISHELVIYAGVLHGFLHMSRMLDKAHEAITSASQTFTEAFSRNPN